MADIQLFKYFESIDDPRQQSKVVYKLFDIIFLAVSAVVSGCQGWEDIEDFGYDRLDWLRKYVPLEQGIPRHDTIARVMSRIDMTQFQDSFSSWMKGCSKLTHGDVVAIDGKRLKVHLLSQIDAMHFIWSVHLHAKMASFWGNAPSIKNQMK